MDLLLCLMGIQPTQTLPLHPLMRSRLIALGKKPARPIVARARKSLIRVDRRVSDGPFRVDWESLATYQVPDWYKDAKFGIFVHWGLYSVPAFGSEQYPRLMYTVGTKEYDHQLSTYGSLTKFGYKDFIPMLTAEHYKPSAWASLFKQSGARYVVPVFEHHDGFAMYNSALSDWTAFKMGPHRDLAGELAEAVRAAGLHLGASSHRIEHDWFMRPGRQIESDVNDPRLAAFYGPAHLHFALDENSDNFLEDWTYVSPEFADDWLARGAEVVEKYHPELFYFDFWIGKPEVRPDLARFAAFFYNETLNLGFSRSHELQARCDATQICCRGCRTRGVCRNSRRILADRHLDKQ